MVRRALIAVACVVVVGLGWTYYELRKYKASNETDMPGDIGAAPDFYASDPRLLEPGPRKIQLRLDPSVGEPKGAPYFITFADGSYVWGRAGWSDGLTREIYSDQPYQVHWYEDADEEWLRRHPSGSP